MLTSAKEIVNGLSPQLIAEFQEKFDKLPKKLKYQFHISRRNPDPLKTGGDVVYNSLWELQPVTFHIKDPYDKQTKKIGIVNEYDNEQRPVGYKRVTLVERDRGMLYLKKEDLESFDTFCYLELHPANKDGKFRNDQIPGLFNYVNEAREAKQKDQKRKLKTDAMYVAANLTTQEEKNFALAMDWDEDMDADVLHEKIGEFAENDPERFRDFMESKNLDGKALVKRAENNGVIDWEPTEYRYVWSSTKETLVAFGRQDNLDRLEKMSEWLMNKQEVANKIKALLKAGGVKS